MASNDSPAWWGLTITNGPEAPITNWTIEEYEQEERQDHQHQRL